MENVLKFTIFRNLALSNHFVREVRVNRSRSAQAALRATHCIQGDSVNHEVVDVMPKGEGFKVEIVFFKPDLSILNGHISHDDLEKQYELLGLKPADPISVAAVNEADQGFLYEKSHCTHWKDAQGNWCNIRFYSGFLYSENEFVGYVSVLPDSSGFDDQWWFAGIRKEL